MARATSKKPRNGEPAAVYTMTRLDQVRAMSDPLRVRILEALSVEARTTKQVAELLGEKPTRLYHHVEALARTGLIRLTETRPVRGAVEKYYRAVALAFRADERLFRKEGAGGAERQAMSGVVSTMLERTADEMRTLIAAEGDGTIREAGVLAHLEVRGTAREIAAIRTKLNALLEQINRKPARPAAAEGERRFRFTLAFFPLDAPRPRGSVP